MPNAQPYETNICYIGNDKVVNKHRYADFKCYCGNIFRTTVGKIKSGHTKSCGCLHSKGLSERNTVHGLRSKPEYSLWLNMKQRCSNPKFPKYENWGGRGITVCERWIDSFENFYNDMGEKPSHCRGLDRIDNNKGYSMENCRWATSKEQNNNKRNNHFVEYNGRRNTLSQWATELGFREGILLHRLTNKWSVEKAFETPIKKRHATAR